jgi:hypothetical protein
VTCLVCGRTEYAEPLVEVGTVEDGADVLASLPGDWVELVVIPERAIQWIVRNGEEVHSA